MPFALRATDRASFEPSTRSDFPSAALGATAGAISGATTATAPPATPSSLTDRMRLRSAFRALRGSGLIARQALECCSTCARAALRDLLLDPADSRSYDGYAYYTQLDHREAAEGAGLFVRYGSTSGTRADTCAVGARVVDTLVSAGLRPSWSGQPEDAIYVPLVWTW